MEKSIEFGMNQEVKSTIKEIAENKLGMESITYVERGHHAENFEQHDGYVRVNTKGIMRDLCLSSTVYLFIGVVAIVTNVKI